MGYDYGLDLPTPSIGKSYDRRADRGIPSSVRDQDALTEPGGGSALDDSVDTLRTPPIRQQGSSGAAGVDDVYAKRSPSQSGGVRRATTKDAL